MTDIVRSKSFYDELFGWPIAIDSSDAVDEPGVNETPERFWSTGCGAGSPSKPRTTLLDLLPERLGN